MILNVGYKPIISRFNTFLAELSSELLKFQFILQEGNKVIGVQDVVEASEIHLLPADSDISLPRMDSVN